MALVQPACWSGLIFPTKSLLLRHHTSLRLLPVPSFYCFGNAVVMPLLSNSRTPFRAASLIGLLFLSARHVSAASDNTDIAGAASWQVADSVAGFKLLYGEPVTLEKRQSTCASNGSNYCFGDSVSFCSSCGLCCGSSSSGYCCGAAQVCCGTACCASGQTCSDGKCLAELCVNGSYAYREPSMLTTSQGDCNRNGRGIHHGSVARCHGNGDCRTGRSVDLDHLLDS